MNLEVIQIQMPTTNDEVDSLFIKLKVLEGKKKELDAIKAVIKEQEDLINKVLKEYADVEFMVDSDFKFKGEHGTIQKRKQSSWKYGDEKSIIKQLKVIDPSLIRVKEEIDKVKLKKKAMVGTDGEIILGSNFSILENIVVEDLENISISVKKEGEKDDGYEVVE